MRTFPLNKQVILSHRCSFYPNTPQLAVFWSKQFWQLTFLKNMIDANRPMHLSSFALTQNYRNYKNLF